MTFIPDRLGWIFYRRLLLQQKLEAFIASPLSYCDEKCSFEGYNSLKKGVRLYSCDIGYYTYFAEAACARNVTFGRFCSIGPETIIGNLPRHDLNGFSTHPSFYSASICEEHRIHTDGAFPEYLPTVVEADVFIGARALVLPGVTLGVGCVVGAGSIVTKNIPPYAVAVGAPAKVIRRRLPSDRIDALLAAKWWTLPLSEIREFAKQQRESCSLN